MNGRTGFGVRMVALVLVIAGLLVSAVRPAGAQETGVTIFDPAPAGIETTVTASADVTQPEGSNVLFIEGMFIGACTAGEWRNPFGPTLVAAQSYQVTIRYAAEGRKIDRLLGQGESALVPADTAFTLINGMSDSAFPAEVTILAVTTVDKEAKTFAATQPAVKLLDPFADWPADSHCGNAAENPRLQATFKNTGVAGRGATKLYLGLGVWQPGATTDGMKVGPKAATFNLLLLAGGMPTAGFSTGRAVYNGPRQVLSDSSAEGTQFEDVPSEPFQNPGTAPVVGIIFGTAAAGEPVFVPIES